MNLIKYRWLFVGIFVTTMLLSVAFIFVNTYNQWGTKPGSPLNLGIDFTGGTKIYFPLPKAVTSDEVSVVLKSVQKEIPHMKFQAPQPAHNPDSTGVERHYVMVYTSFLNDTEQGIVIKALEAQFGKATERQGLEINRIDPLVGKELVNNALTAVLIASALMIIYIWIRFELVSGIAAIIALLHDCILVVGMTALFGLEVNATIIAAVLTVLGYSINDTIVVFDRIRENVKYRTRDSKFVDIVNDSILQTFRRSLNTSFTTVLAIMVLFVVVPQIRELCFALLVGITSGTYSSIFIASPIWAVYKDWQEKKRLLTKTAVAR
ncbi:MAG TPA: protein translocase subunit SecF [Bacillota bacterium]|nr:protein translocase subunit SecF [Bacillota bacterium]